MFDTSALREPVDEAEVRAFRKETLATGDPDWSPQVPLRSVLGWLASLVILPVVGASILINIAHAPSSWHPFIWGIFILIVIADGVYLFRRDFGRSRWRDHLRCVRFAAANELSYAPRTVVATHPGFIFRAGSEQETVLRMWSETGPITDCGVHRYVTGWGRNRQQHEWQYAAIRLPGALPYLMLDAKANNTFAGDLSERFVPGFKQSLGGDLDQHFDLYCAPEHRVDAFYIVTPDLMAHLIDHAAHFDVELVGRWMFLYTRFGLSVSDPETWVRLGAIEQTVARLVRRRAEAYRDLR
ncbi:hypothetical protein [Microlunatus speluncae]|uniref:hypothetical protein n=1 Tax=Microlunatus speluncae TaxID=2594267 RepID=UPI001266086A|nr:hypothetical protein [Microlunatus speluncae]